MFIVILFSVFNDRQIICPKPASATIAPLNITADKIIGLFFSGRATVHKIKTNIIGSINQALNAPKLACLS